MLLMYKAKSNKIEMFYNVQDNIVLANMLQQI